MPQTSSFSVNNRFSIDSVYFFIFLVLFPLMHSRSADDILMLLYCRQVSSSTLILIMLKAFCSLFLQSRWAFWALSCYLVPLDFGSVVGLIHTSGLRSTSFPISWTPCSIKTFLILVFQWQKLPIPFHLRSLLILKIDIFTMSPNGEIEQEERNAAVKEYYLEGRLCR